MDEIDHILHRLAGNEVEWLARDLCGEIPAHCQHERRRFFRYLPASGEGMDLCQDCGKFINTEEGKKLDRWRRMMK